MDGKPCPCGSGEQYDTCCGRYISGAQLPECAEALMRSRYSAFVLGDIRYLKATWAPEFVPATLTLEPDTQWLGLEVIATSAGSADDESGTVEFIARFRQGGRVHQLHEVSRFRRDGERWLYLDGVFPAGSAEEKVGRNAPCPCGSGKKYKRCCGR